MKFHVNYDDVAGAFRMARTFLDCKCPFHTVCAISIPDIYPSDYDPNDPNDFENLVGMYGNDGFEMRAYCIGCHKRIKFVCGMEELPYISQETLDLVHETVQKQGCWHWDQLDISPKLGVRGYNSESFLSRNDRLQMHKVYCHRCRKVFDVMIPSLISVDIEPMMTFRAW